jgi:ABC-type antimicrobial peptide transport system permease subunit
MKCKSNPGFSGRTGIRVFGLRVAIALLAAVLAGGQALLATFNGAIHGISRKQITIETAEGNLLDFDISKKTRVMRGKKQVAPEELQTGDAVTIEAKEEAVGYLTAVTITAKPSAKK